MFQSLCSRHRNLPSSFCRILPVPFRCRSRCIHHRRCRFHHRRFAVLIVRPSPQYDVSPITFWQVSSQMMQVIRPNVAVSVTVFPAIAIFALCTPLPHTAGSMPISQSRCIHHHRLRFHHRTARLHRPCRCRRSDFRRHGYHLCTRYR